MSLMCSLHLLLAHGDIWLLASPQSVQKFAHRIYEAILPSITTAKLLHDVIYNQQEQFCIHGQILDHFAFVSLLCHY